MNKRTGTPGKRCFNIKFRNENIYPEITLTSENYSEIKADDNCVLAITRNEMKLLLSRAISRLFTSSIRNA